MSVRLLVAVLAVVAIGVAAGLLVGTGLSAGTARSLAEPTWTSQFQAEDRLFSRLMPPFFLTTLGLLIASAWAWHRETSLFAVATVLMLVVLVVTVRFEVPLNRQIQTWGAGRRSCDLGRGARGVAALSPCAHDRGAACLCERDGRTGETVGEWTGLA